MALFNHLNTIFIMYKQDETFALRTKCMRRIHCAAFRFFGLCSLHHNGSILRFGGISSTLQHQKFNIFCKFGFLCKFSLLPIPLTPSLLYSIFQILVQDIRSRIHTNRNLVSIHFSAVHIHCDVLVLAYAKTLHCLRLVNRTEMDVSALAIAAFLQQYV